MGAIMGAIIIGALFMLPMGAIMGAIIIGALFMLPMLLMFMLELMPFIICVSWRPAHTERKAVSAHAFQRTQAG